MTAQPIKSVLIANRGEIAARIIRSCKALGMRSIAVFSDPDESSLYTSLADEAYPLGGESAAESYLQGEKLIALALRTGADAIHPGYGFLAENPTFAEAVEKHGIRFVGPSAATMRLLGHKHSARLLAKQHGLPISPGYDGDDQSDATLREQALALGFPLLVKAAAGGGGKGMRRVEREEELTPALTAARREAESFFADGRLILERVFAPARHIEVQLLADMHGNIVHLFERDCSLQRSYQKLIEEAPARALPAPLRAQLYEAAITIGKAVHLHGAATVEFLVSPDSAAALLPFVFLEVNPRLQVEHPVTEMVTGVDIVEQQLRIASGATLDLKQAELSLCGHAIEARICAENPMKGFLPTGGRITAVSLPKTSAALRIEHSLAPTYLVTSNYDSLLAKVITAGNSFEEAALSLTNAVDSLQICGIDTNGAFILELLRSDRFRDTAPLTSSLGSIDTTLTLTERRALLGYFAFLLPLAKRSTTTFSSLGSWRAGAPVSSSVPPRTISLRCETAAIDHTGQVRLIESLQEDNTLARQRIAVDDTECVIQARFESNGVVQLTLDDRPLRALVHSSAAPDELFYSGHRIQFVERFPKHGSAEQQGESLQKLRSPLPGKILGLPITVGQRIGAGQLVAILESMKMEHAIAASAGGIVAEIGVREGESVQSGDLIAVIDTTTTAKA